LLDAGCLRAVDILTPLLHLALELELDRGTPSMDHYALELLQVFTRDQLDRVRNCIAGRVSLDVEGRVSFAPSTRKAVAKRLKPAGKSTRAHICEGDQRFREAGVLTMAFMGGEFMDDHATIFLLGSLLKWLHCKYIVYIVSTASKGSRGPCLENILGRIGQEHFIDLSGSTTNQVVDTVLALGCDLLFNTCVYTSGQFNGAWNRLVSLAQVY